jgi:hypothetical protein
MNRQLSDRIEYLNQITSKKYKFTQTNIIPVFLTLFHPIKSRNSGDKHPAIVELTTFVD